MYRRRYTHRLSNSFGYTMHRTGYEGLMSYSNCYDIGREDIKYEKMKFDAMKYSENILFID